MTADDEVGVKDTCNRIGYCFLAEIKQQSNKTIGGIGGIAA